REEISQAVAALIADAKLSPRDATLMQDEEEKLIAAADIVTRARTEVETDFRGNVIDAHEFEMPTRFAKQLALIFRGALSIGIGRESALALALRCARDSIPPVRLGVLKDLAAAQMAHACRTADLSDRSHPSGRGSRPQDAGGGVRGQAMAKRVDVSRLTPRQKYYLAGFRRGLTQAMSEARTLFREQLHETFRELEQLRTAYSEL